MQPDATPRLETKHLMRRYGGQLVVDDVSLEVMPGQVTCLLGPSGCGKSTTLRMIAGVEMQDEGEIWVDGKLICDTVFRVPPERRHIGLMFQDFALFPHLSVGANVAFGLSGDKGEIGRRVEELLNRVGLGSYTDKFPHELSGGEQQRVALARALAPRPRIMLMDEPFSGLDNRLRDGIRDETLDILREQDTAVLLVTHEPEEAMRMADQIALMRDGRIVQQGAPYNIYNAPVDRDAVAFFSDINVIRGRVEGSLVQTAFGQFLAPGVHEGNEVDIVIRPQHMKIDFDRLGVAPIRRSNGTPGAWHRGTRALHGVRKPCGVSHGSRRLAPEGDCAQCVLAETGDTLVADDPPRPLLYLSGQGLMRHFMGGAAPVALQATPPGYF